jgi:hypothetical protein
VDEAEIDRLCEELRDLIEVGPGVTPDALSQARGIIQVFQSTRSGDDVNQKLGALIYGFEQWFGDNHSGQVVKDCLHANVIGLRAAMAMARILRGKSGS